MTASTQPTISTTLNGVIVQARIDARRASPTRIDQERADLDRQARVLRDRNDADEDWLLDNTPRPDYRHNGPALRRLTDLARRSSKARQSLDEFIGAFHPALTFGGHYATTTDPTGAQYSVPLPTLTLEAGQAVAGLVEPLRRLYDAVRLGRPETTVRVRLSHGEALFTGRLTGTAGAWRLSVPGAAQARDSLTAALEAATGQAAA